VTWFEILVIGACVSLGAAVAEALFFGIRELMNSDSPRRSEARSELFAAVRSTWKVWLPLLLWIGFVVWLPWNASRH
jgi:branched-subunit amino acid ABC-type transport system permease component